MVEQHYQLVMRVIAYLLISLCTSMAGGEPSHVFANGHAAHPSRILARFKDAAQTRTTNTLALLSAAGVTIQREFRLVPGLVVLDELRPGVVRTTVTPPLAEPKKDGRPLMERMAVLRNTGLFEYVEPDFIFQSSGPPNDQYFNDGTLWGLRNTGQNGGTHGADIGAEAAWELTTGSTNVIVAVLDTGIRYTHQDLAQQMWRNPGEIPGNGLDDDGDGYVDDIFGINAITGTGNPMDDHAHGTHVAGTIGAGANNGRPHVGAAQNARIMAVKAGNSKGQFDNSAVIEGIQFVVEKECRVINASFGFPAYSKAQFDAIAAAGLSNVLFIAAAGNNAANNDAVPAYPASFPLDNIISVAAIDRLDGLASFSNYGRRSVHVAAPGKEVFSCSSATDSDYISLEGTSMAAPHVSGIAALVRARFPSASVTELKSRILTSAVQTPALQGKVSTGGRVNAFRALTARADGNMEVRVQPTADSTLIAGETVTLTTTVTDITDVTNASVSASISGVPNVTFRNDGATPDRKAGDASYTTTFTVPTGLTALNLNLSASAPGKLGKSLSIAYSVRQPPVNDNFANQLSLSGSTVTAYANNVGASKESNEPNHAGRSGGKSIWWSWTAPASGVVVIAGIGQNLAASSVAVYTGSSLGSLVSVGIYDPLNYGYAGVSFNATAGVNYKIAVDTEDGATGDIMLRLLYGNSPRPINDNLANLLPLNGDETIDSGSNAGATSQVGEPNHAGNAPQKSVWWSWTAPYSGWVTISTDGSSFDTLLAVYSASLISVASNDDEILWFKQTSKVTFYVTGGTTYYIAVDGFGGAYGNIMLSLLLQQASNDGFSNRYPILTGTQDFGSNVGATKVGGEPRHGNNDGGRSVWWTWTAPSSGRVTVSTSGSDFDTLLGVYTGSSVTALRPIAGNDDYLSPGGPSHVFFNSVAGMTYQIAVDGYSGASGNISLALNFAGVAGAIYATGFESIEGFMANQPLSTNGWLVRMSGEVGVVSGVFPSGGQQAFVSSPYPTAGTEQYVYMPLNFTPAPDAVVRFAVRMRITDSTAGQRDAFRWQVFDTNVTRLFNLHFNSFDQQISYILSNGTPVLTGATFVRGQIHDLVVTMDFGRNLWSAYLDTQAIVTGQPIGANPNALTLGDIDAVWQARNPTQPGNNRMYFDDYRVALMSPQAPELKSGSQLTDQGFHLTLTGSAGSQYVIEAAPDPTKPASWVEIQRTQNTNGLLKFTDFGAVGQPKRFYRVKELP
jgi:subtilisin family serine protease